MINQILETPAGWIVDEPSFEGQVFAEKAEAISAAFARASEIITEMERELQAGADRETVLPPAPQEGEPYSDTLRTGQPPPWNEERFWREVHAAFGP